MSSAGPCPVEISVDAISAVPVREIRDARALATWLDGRRSLSPRELLAADVLTPVSRLALIVDCDVFDDVALASFAASCVEWCAAHLSAALAARPPRPLSGWASEAARSATAARRLTSAKPKAAARAAAAAAAWVAEAVALAQAFDGCDPLHPLRPPELLAGWRAAERARDEAWVSTMHRMERLLRERGSPSAYD